MTHFSNICELSFFGCNVYVLNQCSNRFLFHDALHFVLSMCLKFKEEIEIQQPWTI